MPSRMAISNYWPTENQIRGSLPLQQATAMDNPHPPAMATAMREYPQSTPAQFLASINAPPLKPFPQLPQREQRSKWRFRWHLHQAGSPRSLLRCRVQPHLHLANEHLRRPTPHGLQGIVFARQHRAIGIYRPAERGLSALLDRDEELCVYVLRERGTRCINHPVQL